MVMKSMESGSAFSFTTTRGHTTHISLLWLFVLFSFLCVAIVLLAGQQDGLKTRDFPDTKVNGDLEVTGTTSVEGDVTFDGDLTTTGAIVTTSSLGSSSLTVTNGATVGTNLTVTGRSLARAFRAGLTVSTVTTATTLTYAADTITVNDFTGAAVQAVTLPAATVGTKVIHYQDADTGGGTTALTFTCATGDAYRTGSVLLGTVVGGGNTLATSAADDTIITYTPADALTNFVTKGSQFIFWCVSDGTWDVEFDNSEMLAGASPETVLTGAVAFS